MADGGRDIFVYRGGQAPLNVTHVRIDKSVEVIEHHAFDGCDHLVKVETHDGIRKVGERAFQRCNRLRSIDLRSADEIGSYAFYGCKNLTGVEFSKKLETIGTHAFDGCTSLKRLKLLSVITVRAGAFQSCMALTSIEFSERLDTIETGTFRRCTSLERLRLPSIIAVRTVAFKNCDALTSIEFSERLETIEPYAFSGCGRIRRIAIPLKRDLFTIDPLLRKYTQFKDCHRLTTVDLVGGAHDKTISSLHMESWRIEMKEEINRINQDLPNTLAFKKTAAIKQWMDSVIDKMEYYKAQDPDDKVPPERPAPPGWSDEEEDHHRYNTRSSAQPPPPPPSPPRNQIPFPLRNPRADSSRDDRSRGYDPEGVGRNLRDSLGIFGLGPSAVWTEVRAKYIQFSRIYHPDKHNSTRTKMSNDEAKAFFQLINNAKDFLEDRLSM